MAKGTGLKLGRIVRVRKDGSDVEFVAWNGEKRRAKYGSFATVYGRKNDRGWSLSVAVDKNATLDTANEWMNFYFEPGVTITVDEQALAAAANRFSKGGQRKPQPERSGDDDEDNPFK